MTAVMPDLEEWNPDVFHTLVDQWQKPMVILVSGWSGPGFEFFYIKKLLKLNGFDVAHFIQKHNGWGDITENAKNLAAMVNTIQLTGRKVFVLGHSLGGLIAKKAQDQCVPHAIATIATPHEGTWMAKLAPWSTSARQMQPGSDFIANNNMPSWCPMLNIGCRFDEVVIPHDSMVHQHADKVEWVNHTHITVMFSLKTTLKIVEYFKSFT